MKITSLVPGTLVLIEGNFRREWLCPSCSFENTHPCDPKALNGSASCTACGKPAKVLISVSHKEESIFEVWYRHQRAAHKLEQLAKKRERMQKIKG